MWYTLIAPEVTSSRHRDPVAATHSESTMLQVEMIFRGRAVFPEVNIRRPHAPGHHHTRAHAYRPVRAADIVFETMRSEF